MRYFFTTSFIFFSLSCTAFVCRFLLTAAEIHSIATPFSPVPVAMAASQLLLAPSEFPGDANTRVCGRVVLLRGPFTVGGATTPAASSGGKSPSSSKGKGKGAGKQREAIEKLEVHILGVQARFSFWKHGARQPPT